MLRWYDMIRSICFVDMILWFDMIFYGYLFDSIWFVNMLWWCDLFRFVPMPEFINYSWRYHGRVIEAPMAWHFLWRCDWSTASPLCMIWLWLWDLLAIYDMCTPVLRAGACMFMYVCMGGVWMHLSTYVYVWLWYGYMYGELGMCSILLHVWELATPCGTERSPLSVSFDVTDMWYVIMWLCDFEIYRVPR